MQAGFSSVKVWWKNAKQRILAKQLKKLQLVEKDNSEEEGEDDGDKDDGDKEEEESEKGESEGDDLSGDEMGDYVEVQNAKQTKRWNAFVVGIL